MTGRGRTLDSPVGKYEFLRVKPELMGDGNQWSDTHHPCMLATKEKALLDVVYPSTRKNRRFARLPELDLEASGFLRRKFERLLRDLPYPVRIRSAILSRWQTILGQ
jgi:hypothetical protein